MNLFNDGLDVNVWLVLKHIFSQISYIYMYMYIIDCGQVHVLVYRQIVLKP